MGIRRPTARRPRQRDHPRRLDTVKRPADPDQQEGGALCLNWPIPYVRRTPGRATTELNFDVRASQINQLLSVHLRNIFDGWDADRLCHDPQDESRCASLKPTICTGSISNTIRISITPAARRQRSRPRRDARQRSRYCRLYGYVTRAAHPCTRHTATSQQGHAQTRGSHHPARPAA